MPGIVRRLFIRRAAALCFVLASCGQAQTYELLAPLGSRDGGPLILTGDAEPADSGERDANVMIGVDGGPIPQRRADGEPCTADSQCEHEKCLPDPAFPGGFCTKTNCRNDSECSAPSDVCVSRTGPDICANGCTSDGDCRDGYLCYAASSGEDLACLPAGQKPVQKKFDGEACERDNECEGGTCLQHPTWPDGHCTTEQCGLAVECKEGDHDAACFSTQQVCLWTCATSADCRDGYVCSPQPQSLFRACVPSSAIEPEMYPFDMTCGLAATNGELHIPFTVSPNANAYTITVLTRDMSFLSPSLLATPAGDLQLNGDHLFMSGTAQIHGWVAPFNVPMVQQDAMMVTPGLHEISFFTETTDACWYYLEERTPGTKIDIDFYFVGVPGLDAARAQNDRDFTQLVTELDRIFQQIDLSVGRTRFHDITARSDVERFSVIQSDGDFLELMSRSVQPSGADLDDHLSVNVFFVETITIGALGISSALGGPPGLHHTTASGVVSTSEFFGTMGTDPFTGEPIDGDLLSALIVAHEIGHYMNLYHTTEIDGSAHDPVLDTEECTNIMQPETCAVAGNVMFSSAIGTNFTPGQGFSMQSHALSKE